MNKLFTIALISFLACTIKVHAQEITFKETEHDFGLIDELHGDVHYDFEFTNTGTAPQSSNKLVTK